MSTKILSPFFHGYQVFTGMWLPASTVSLSALAAQYGHLTCSMKYSMQHEHKRYVISRPSPKTLTSLKNPSMLFWVWKPRAEDDRGTGQLRVPEWLWRRPTADLKSYLRTISWERENWLKEYRSSSSVESFVSAAQLMLINRDNRKFIKKKGLGKGNGGKPYIMTVTSNVGFTWKTNGARG